MLQPGRVTKVTENGDVLGQPQSFFAASGCDSGQSGLRIMPFIAILIGGGILAVVVGAVLLLALMVGGVGAIAWYLRRNREEG